MYIKQVELSHFKSFGGTVAVPLLEGFTVISGPNGSGKSNILDALLFALGLSSSKGMRAERLPDLVNQAYSSRSRSTVEASVSVTFDLSDLPEAIFADDDEELDSTSVDETVELLMNGSIAPSEEANNGHANQNIADNGINDSNGDAPGNAQGTVLSGAEDSHQSAIHNAHHANISDANGNGNGQVETAKDSSNGHQAVKSAENNTGEAASEVSENLSNPDNGHVDNTPESTGPTILPLKEWTVTRRLRVTPQGTYTSTYLLNGESCTLTQLHEQLQRCRIYPEGYNVVLQGDVTSIISMNAKERRGIIDELAGVAAFDRRINQAKGKLDEVQEREERFRIVEQELTEQRDRLAKDRLKAEKYQKLRTQFQEKSQWEGVMIWRDQQKQLQGLRDRLTRDEKKLVTLNQHRGELDAQIKTASAELDKLNAKVRALGEDEQLALQSTLATQEAEQKQLQRQQSELATATDTTTQQFVQSDTTLKDHRQTLENLQTAQVGQTAAVEELSQACDQLSQELAQRRQAADEIASASEAWVQEQAKLRHEIDDLLKELQPLRTEQVRLQERIQQLEQRIQTQSGDLEVMATDLSQKQEQQTNFQSQHQSEIDQVQSLAATLAAAEQELQIQQDTKARLLDEQRQKQRELDKLEAQTQAQQESQGTYATKILLQTDLPGLCGLVAQLGRVDEAYQQALEIAAGGRLGFLVVEDDRVASAGIRILKEQRAGRATFLPLNKIRPPKVSMVSAWNRPDGFIDYAVNLIECDRQYDDVFAFVFGGTVIFETLAQARGHMGKFRMVTLDGELLEMSGAMTGGSLKARQGSLHFGTVEAGESAEAIALRERLQVIERILDRCEGAIAQATVTIKDTTDALATTRQQQQEVQFTFKQLNSQIEEMEQQIEKGRSQLSQDTQTLGELVVNIAKLEQTVPHMEADLQHKRQQLNELEQSQTHSEWQQAQAVIRECEQTLATKQAERRTVEQQLQDGVNQKNRLEEKIQSTEQRILEYQAQQESQQQQQITLTAQLEELSGAIAQTKAGLATLEQTLSEEKKERDRAEKALKDQQDQHQQTVWNIEKIQERYQETIEAIAHQQQQVEESQAELPDPIPEIPEELTLEDLQKELRSLQRRMQSLEPVNMLALEEYERTQERLEELSGKLATLDEERTELLLRIENFTTLRCRAFKEAFDAVNENFQSIFAELSDGDGYLQLDDPKDPFNGGLNLVAHPKGKPVRRLASMSGGEKSLTALSFIFALQRYRPSPFYAFDEVDMFLDGANVERLAKMIRKQASDAQFIVVSLRRPMIEKADRTIGVTQARGAYTQVLGINLQQTK